MAYMVVSRTANGMVATGINTLKQADDIGKATKEGYYVLRYSVVKIGGE